MANLAWYNASTVSSQKSGVSTWNWIPLKNGAAAANGATAAGDTTGMPPQGADSEEARLQDAKVNLGLATETNTTGNNTGNNQADNGHRYSRNLDTPLTPYFAVSVATPAMIFEDEKDSDTLLERLIQI